MRITLYTDYSLRVLLYLGLKGDRASVAEITKSFRISRNHLVKVVHQLGKRGYIKSFKGRGGGIVLAVDPSKIKIGDVVRELEPMDLLECFNRETNTCPIRGVCQLEQALYGAKQAFLEHLNSRTLGDFLRPSPNRDARLKKLGLKIQKPTGSD